MTQPYTIRPREKIATASAQKLTDHELLQAIIGSGTKTVNVKRVARSVVKLFRRSNGVLTYAALRAVPGLGDAYASRIVAAFELTRRWQATDPSPQSYIPMREVLGIGTTSAVATVVCDLYNAAQEVIDRLYIQVLPDEKPASVVRAILVHTLPTQTVYMHVGIIGEHAIRRQYFSDILFGTSLKATLSFIDVTLRQMSVVDAAGEVIEVLL